MSVNGVNGYDPLKVNTTPVTTKKAEVEETTAEEKDVFGKAYVYEKSDNTEGTVNAKDKAVDKFDKGDRTAIIEKLKAEQDMMMNSLMEIVKKTIAGQGNAFMLASEDDMWKFLASGDFTVDATTKAQAQADIAEDGYWGVEKTSDRILDFAKALSGNDPEQADKLLDAFKKGFDEATSTWGRDLPDISQKTYDAVVKKFEDWKNSATKPEENTNVTDPTLVQ
ncbi:MAG: hypothetical protein K5851_03300 [Lachnospiraceae bacterium]|nr:hypothetical protein [Lachnospiraceae bacterium]